MSQKLNKIHDSYQPSTHTIHKMLNYACSDSMLLVFNKKRLILLNSQSKEIVNFCDYPENAFFLTAVSSENGTFVCLREGRSFVVYQYDEGELRHVFDEEYMEISGLQTKSSVHLSFWGSELLVANGNDIFAFRLSNLGKPELFRQMANISALHVVGEFACIGLVYGGILVFRGSFNSQPIELNFHHKPVCDIASLPCDMGRPILFSSDFEQKVAKWVPERNGYKRIVIGPLISCCYNLVEPEDCEYLYAELDCNKIVVFDLLSTQEEFVLSTCPFGRNSISKPEFFTPKIRNGHLMFESVPGSIEVVQTVFSPFCTSELINLYNGYSNADQIFNLQVAEGYLPQVKYFDVMHKNKIVAILESSNSRFANTQLIIADTQGTILFQVNNIMPVATTGLYVNARDIYISSRSGYLKLQLDGDELTEQGFFAWHNENPLGSIENILDGKLFVKAGKDSFVCEESDNSIVILEPHPQAELARDEDIPSFMFTVAPNLYFGVEKGELYIIARRIDELEEEEPVLVAAVDAEAFALPEQAEILISSNSKLRINHASHELPNGGEILDWVVESIGYQAE